MNSNLLIDIKSTDKNLTVLSVKGNLNNDTRDEFSEIIAGLKDKSKNYIFIIDGLKYISSSGIGCFMELYEIVNDKHGKICFVGMNDMIKRIFDYMGFLSFFRDMPTYNDALNEIKKIN